MNYKMFILKGFFSLYYSFQDNHLSVSATENRNLPHEIFFLVTTSDQPIIMYLHIFVPASLVLQV